VSSQPCMEAIDRLKHELQQNGNPLEIERALFGQLHSTLEDGFNTDDTLIIFDWDDTLLPTSWIASQRLLDVRAIEEIKLQPWHRTLLEESAKHAVSTLCAAQQFGTVAIITNSSEGWIQQSCAIFMPALLPHISSLRLVSARTAGGVDPLYWKDVTFNKVIRNVFGARETSSAKINVISIGDGDAEHHALTKAVERDPLCCGKSVRFVDHPNLQVLATQQAVLRHEIHTIAWKQAKLTICLGHLRVVQAVHTPLGRVQPSRTTGYSRLIPTFKDTLGGAIGNLMSLSSQLAVLILAVAITVPESFCAALRHIRSISTKYSLYSWPMCACSACKVALAGALRCSTPSKPRQNVEMWNDE